MKKLTLILLLCIANGSLAQEINTSLSEWDLDSVIFEWGSVATLYFSKTFDIREPDMRIKVLLPMRKFENFEAWGQPILSAITVETVREPILDGEGQGKLYKNWTDSLRRLKDSLESLKVKVKTIEAGIEVLKENRDLPANAPSSGKFLTQWVDLHILTTESLLVQKSKLHKQINQLEEIINSIENFLNSEGNDDVMTREVLIIRPNADSLGTYKIVVRMVSRDVRVTPIMNLIVEGNKLVSPRVIADWVLQIKQNTGFDWKNTNIVYYPKRDDSNEDSYSSIPKPRVIITKASIKPRPEKERRKIIKRPVQTEVTTSGYRLAEAVIVVKYYDPELSVSKDLVLSVIRLNNISLEEGATRSIKVMTKKLKNASISLFAFSGTQKLYHFLNVPTRELYPIIASQISLYRNGSLVGRTKVKPGSDTIRLPIATHQYAQTLTSNLEFFEHSGFFKTRVFGRYRATFTNHGKDTLRFRYVTYVDVKSREINFHVNSKPKPNLRKFNKSRYLLEWNLELLPEQSRELEYEIVFTTKKRYVIEISQEGTNEPF